MAICWLLACGKVDAIDDPGFTYWTIVGYLHDQEKSNECEKKGSMAIYYIEASTGLVFHVEPIPDTEMEEDLCIGTKGDAPCSDEVEGAAGSPSFRGAAGCPTCTGGNPQSPEGTPGQQISFGANSYGQPLGEVQFKPDVFGSGPLLLDCVSPYYEDTLMADEVTILQMYDELGGVVGRQYVAPQVIIQVTLSGSGGLSTLVYARGDAVEDIELLPPDTLLSFDSSAVPITVMDTLRVDAEDKIVVSGSYLGKAFSSVYTLEAAPNSGTIVERLENGKKYVTTTTYVPDVSDLDGQLIVETKDVYYWRSATLQEPIGDYELESSVTRTFRTLLDGKERLISEDVALASFDPDTLAPITVPGLTTFTYEEVLYIQGSSVSKSFGRLLSRTNPDGSWVRYEYDAEGNLMRTYKPWLSAPATAAQATVTNCHLVETLYSDPAEPYLGGVTTTRILGVQVAQETVVRSRDTVTLQDTETRQIWHPAGYAPGVSGPVITQETRVYQRDEYDGFHLLSHQREDGVKAIYQSIAGAPNLNSLGFGADTAAVAGYLSAANLQNLSADYEISPLTSTGSTVAGRTKKVVQISDETGRTLGRFIWVATSSGAAGFSGSTVTYQLVDGEFHQDDFIAGEGYSSYSTSVYALDGSLIQLSNQEYYSDGSWADSSRGTLEALKYVVYRSDGSVDFTSEYQPGGWDKTVSIITFPFYLNGSPVPLAKMTENRESSSSAKVTAAAEDMLGQTIWQKDVIGRETYYLRSGTTLTEVRPGNVRVITQRHLDGSLASISGNGSMPESHTYEVNADGTISETVQSGQIGAGHFWTRTIRDYAGNVLATQQPKPPTNPEDSIEVSSAPIESVTLWRDSSWRTVMTTSPVEQTLTVYDALGEVLKQGIDVDANGVLSLTSSDVFTDYSAGIPASGIQQITENGVTAWWEVKSQLSPVTQNVTPAVTAISSQRKQLGTAVPLMVTIAPDGTRTDEETILDGVGYYTVLTTVKRPGAVKGEVTGRGYSHGGVFDESLPGLTASIQHGFSEGQVSSIEDPRRPIQFFEYNAIGQLAKMTELGGSDATGILPDRQTLYRYYPATHANAGKLKEVVHPDGKKETYVYDLLGRVTAINPLTFNASGTVLNRDEMANYPVSYTYNAHGQKETMTVWRNEAGASTPEVTTWSYWFGGGPLAQKLWSLNENFSLAEMYYYHSANQLASRYKGAVTTQYTYDGAGRLTGKTYSDGTPSVSISYDRVGRQTSVTDGSGTRTIAYNGLSREWSSIDYGGGPLHGTGLRHTFDAQGRPLTLGVTRKKTSTTWDPRTLATYTYGEDTTQLASVQFGSHTAHYQAYDSDGNGQNDAFETLGTLPAEILYKVAQSTSVTRTSLKGTRLSVNVDGSNTLQYIPKQLLWQRGTTYSGGVDLFTDVIKHDYRHDLRGRRTSDVQLDGTVWAHEYNSRGEVVGAARSDNLAGNPGPGRRFGYAYDDIGNRTAAVENTFDNGDPNLPAIDYDKTTYTTNKSNAYEVLSHSDPSKYWVLGRTSTGTGTLLVKHTKTGTTTPVVTAPVDRYGVGDKDFAAEIAYGVTTAAAYRNVKVTVGSTTTTWGDLYMPPKQEEHGINLLTGNLSGDSRWIYDWDAENRLISMETTTTAITAGVPKQRLEFTYDNLNRRVRKVRKGWVSNAWVVQADLRFLYDGWNLVAELEPVVVTSATSLPAYVRTYTWGKDVTGTEQGAGGVGGLLFVGRYTKDTGTNVLATTLAPMYDGNSNIEGYVKLLVPTASTSAASVEAFKLEYDPFGRELMIAATSPETQATLPPFRFSTQYTDSETDLVYYINRYYSPELGRWISRDPIEERGGLNLYGMVGNDPVNRWDYLGLQISTSSSSSGPTTEAQCRDYCNNGYRCQRFSGAALDRVEFRLLNSQNDLLFLPAGPGIRIIITCNKRFFCKCKCKGQESIPASFPGFYFPHMDGIPNSGGSGVWLNPNEWRAFSPEVKDEWWKPATGERIHADSGAEDKARIHPESIAHYDYKDRAGVWWRVYPPDGCAFRK